MVSQKSSGRAHSLVVLQRTCAAHLRRYHAVQVQEHPECALVQLALNRRYFNVRITAVHANILECISINGTHRRKTRDTHLRKPQSDANERPACLRGEGAIEEQPS